MTRRAALLASTVVIAVSGHVDGRVQSAAAPATGMTSALTSVTALVRVVDETTGQSARNLAAGDFSLMVDGTPTPIQRVDVTPGPLRLAVLIDVSRSSDIVESGEGAQLALALDRAVFSTLQPDDRVQIGGLSSRMWLSPWLADRAALVDAVSTAVRRPETERYGPSPLWDQIDQVVNSLAGETGTHAVLVLSDGRATANRLSVGAVALHAAVSNVTVCAIGEAATSTMIQDETTIVRINAAAGLRSIVDTSGGTFLPGVLTAPAYAAAMRAYDPTPQLARLIDAIRDRYAIAFAPPGPDRSPHTIEVTMKDARLRATTRRVFREAGRAGS